MYKTLNFLVPGQLARQGPQAAAGWGRGGDLPRARAEAKDPEGAGGHVAGQRVKGQGDHKPQEQVEVSLEGKLNSNRFSFFPSVANALQSFFSVFCFVSLYLRIFLFRVAYRMCRRDYEDELNFAFLMANKEKLRLSFVGVIFFSINST